MNNLSAIILARNEEKNIKACIECLAFCDEILVIDDGSTDKTAEISGGLGAKVYRRPLKNDFASQRNFGLKKAQGKWVLFVDADELVSPELRNEIIQILNNPEINYEGFFLRREDILWGKRLKHGEFGAIKLLRLAKKEAGLWKRVVHEYWDIEGRPGMLVSPLLHYPHQSLREFVSAVNRQSTLHGRVNFKEGKSANIIKIVFYPKLKFLDNWLIKGGFMDGTEGFVAALIMSFHSFLAWSKQWLKQQEK